MRHWASPVDVPCHDRLHSHLALSSVCLISGTTGHSAVASQVFISIVFQLYAAWRFVHM